MRKLLNTLYIINPDYYLSLENEAVKITCEDKLVGRYPLLNFESIITHGSQGMSSALMGKCMRDNISVVFLSRSGRIQARVSGPTQGNVLLRKTQYRWSDDQDKSLQIARNIIFSKVHNQRWLLDRYVRDHALVLDSEKIRGKCDALKNSYDLIRSAPNLEVLRGLEGEAAQQYFSVFNDLILRQKEDFVLKGRSRRPPLDKVNCLLSYFYTILTHDIGSALEAVGLDPYVGFLHRDRPGRMSLALDLIEELRSVMVDRVVLSAINRLEVNAKQFTIREDGAVVMDDDARRSVIGIWQKRKQDVVFHPFLKENIMWGLVPYSQALLLARFIRGDIDGYPPFLHRV